ncbi:site-specific integrase [Rhodoferax sp. U11-2br]|uniref:tyrosine-type recombinase/integrase n=1 Tax=Rhodoferax sp. U11-2br TaxID=2838878 RepID=UPI001BE693D0|nr:tyrosine-type recombinase/integrase [Rhodoferax sp. U11-2br]MBT3068848.1 tyrosine-type recombinase/integrase [Rhodoferax sp. U11-2br]
MNNFLTAELRLVKARDRAELVVPDQPLIFQYFKDQVDLFTEPTIFLYEKFVSVGGTPSKHTWEGAGYDLVTWFQWCQLNKIDWRSATETDRHQFSDDYFQADSDEKTINRKLTVIRRFYEFARTEGWYHRDIGTSMEEKQVANRPIDEDALAHTRSTGGYRKEKDTLLLKVGRKDVIRPMQVKHLRKLLEHVGPTVQNEQDKRQVRDRLICDLGWTSGTRLGDVTTLTTLQILNITVEPHEQLMDFPLIVEGKMKVTRKVAAPGWLVLAIQAYINGERAASEREGKKRGVKAITGLFLGHAASKSAGKPITRSAIQKMFALACMKTAITEKVEVEDVDTGMKHVKTIPAHSYHDLRHNCAVLNYHAEKAQGNSEPWKIVQIKLGHKSLKVTMDTYLAHVSIFGEKQGVTDIRRLLGLQD